MKEKFSYLFFLLILINFSPTTRTERKLKLWLFVCRRQPRFCIYSWLICLFVWSACPSVCKRSHLSYSHRLLISFIMSFWETREMNSLGWSVFSDVWFVSLWSILSVFCKFVTYWYVSFYCTFCKYPFTCWTRELRILSCSIYNTFWLSFCVSF